MGLTRLWWTHLKGTPPTPTGTDFGAQEVARRKAADIWGEAVRLGHQGPVGSEWHHLYLCRQ